MLTSMLKQHRGKQYAHKQSQERRRQEATTALYKFNEGVMKSINTGVSTSYVNQCALDSEMKQLQTQAAHFTKITSRWINELSAFQTALKELGDVENWATSIENDLNSVANSLEYLHAHSGSVQSTSHKP
uniref:Biogenesis of lysosome-related organelles complex 1 subunit 1 n=1 Tax=Phallusia mammillata TaxID=59560 RepID=A0A6F9D8F2_9ASCI|nr:biogenesis of lysosome-related organelles complex 1 subunit 1-like [Phallusia mammillata]